MRILIQRPLIFINDVGCIVDLELLEKAILWHAKGVVKAPKKLNLTHGYPCVNIYYKKVPVHRLIMQFLNNGSIGPSTHVHHINGNKLDARIENLQLLSASEHIVLTNTGRKASQEVKDKISKAHKGKVREYKFRLKLDLPKDDIVSLYQSGLSIRQISLKYGCDWHAIKLRLNGSPSDMKPYKERNYLAKVAPIRVKSNAFPMR